MNINLKTMNIKSILISIVFAISLFYSFYYYTGIRFRALDFAKFNFDCYGCDITDTYRDYEIEEFELALRNAPDPSFIAKITEDRRYYIHDERIERDTYFILKYLNYLSIILCFIILIYWLKKIGYLLLFLSIIFSLYYLNQNESTENNSKYSYLRNKYNRLETELTDEIDAIKKKCKQNSFNQSISITYN